MYLKTRAAANYWLRFYITELSRYLAILIAEPCLVSRLT